MRRIVFVVFFIPLFVNAQIINMRIDKDNLNHNSAILDDVLLNVFGEKQVEDWLDQDVSFLLLYDINEKGAVTKVYPIRSYKNYKLTENELKQVVDYIKAHNIHFPYCVGDDTGLGFEKKNELARKRLQEGGVLFSNSFFPGQGYYWQKRSRASKDLTTSISCLKDFILKYKTPTIREQIIIERVAIYDFDESYPLDSISTIHYDNIFFDAYDELSAMLDKRIHYDFERAKYLVEKACDCSLKECIKSVDSIMPIDGSNHLDLKANFPSMTSKDDSLSTVLSGKEGATYMLYLLGVGYFHKYNQSDFFTSLCTKKISEDHPHD